MLIVTSGNSGKSLFPQGDPLYTHLHPPSLKKQSKHWEEPSWYMRSAYKGPWTASLLLLHYTLTTPTIGKPVSNATTLDIFGRTAPTTNILTAWTSALVTPNIIALIIPPHLHPCPHPPWGTPPSSITPHYIASIKWSLLTPLSLKATGALEFGTVALTPPTDMPLSTPITMIPPGMQMKIPISAVPPPTGISDLQDSCLTLLWSFSDNMGVMLWFLT